MTNVTSLLVKISVILFVLINTATAANKYSVANGNWTTGSTWSNTLNGATCNCTPVKSDNIYISNNVTLDKDLTGGAQGLTGILTINTGAILNGNNTYSLEMRTGSTLTGNGSLTVKDITLNSGSNILFQTGSTVTVNGTFLNKTGSSNITINGAVAVNGTFTNQSSGVITGTGSIYISNGPATNGASATIFGLTSVNPCSSFPCTLPVPLPIELIAFGASRSGYSVEVKWATAAEINNDYFTIEYSSNLIDWKDVAKIKGAGNSVHQEHYAYIDNAPMMTNGYYRLRQTDFDGNYQLFNPVFVAGMDDFRLRVYPNPTLDNKVTINLLQSDINTAVIKVYDMTGSEVRTKLLPDSSSGAINIEIDSDAVKSARMFYVTAICGNKVLREKLVIN